MRPLLLLLQTLFVCYLRTARAAQNITVDDTDPSITYNGAWEDAPFDPLNAGGTHKVSDDADSSASFTFVGTAIYFYSPLWPFRVTTAISLDGSDPVLLDLRDHNAPFQRDAGETVESAVVWFQDGLEDTEHTLLMSVGVNEDFAVVDQLVYTIPSPGDPSTTPPTSTTSNSRLLPIPTASATQAASTSSNSSKQGLSIALGIVCTVFGLIVIYGIYWYWRRRQRMAEEESYLAGDDNPEMSDVSNTRPTYPKSSFLRNASAAAAAARASKLAGKRRRPPPPPRPGARRSANALRAATKEPLTTIQETSFDGHGRPMSLASRSSSYQHDRSSIVAPPSSPPLSRDDHVANQPHPREPDPSTP